MLDRELRGTIDSFPTPPHQRKSACIVREMIKNPSQRVTYTNIETKGVKNCKLITPDMLIVKEQTGTKKDGTPVYQLKLNIEFWQSIHEPINVVIDEAHTLVNARKSMSKVNILMTDWLALIRRVLGNSAAGYGELTLITQLDNRLDIIAREMATNVRYHLCHYVKRCGRCKNEWRETSDTPEPIFVCEQCGWQGIKKQDYKIEVWHFSSMMAYKLWREVGRQTYHRHYMVNDIEEVFKHYNTVQWSSMLSTLY